MFYSSINRYECIEIKRSGTDLEVFLLSEGSSPGNLSTFEADVDFIRENGLSGLVVESRVFLRHSRFAQKICEGMKVLTFGSKNKCLGNIRKQIDLGIVGIITDTIGSLVYLLSAEILWRK